MRDTMDRQHGMDRDTRERPMESHSTTEDSESSEKAVRKIIVPGEMIVKGSEYLPGDFTTRRADAIVATRFGLAEVSGRLVKVIPLAGVYIPRRGNVVIGKVVDVTFNGWLIDIEGPYSSFLSALDAGRYVSKQDLTDFLNFGDMVVAEVFSVKRKGVDLTLKAQGLGKLSDGLIVRVNSNKVPRVIGREGSMVNLIKKETGCNIAVGQNGLIWVKGPSIESELFAKEAIMFIVEKSFVEGLTDKVKAFLSKNSSRKPAARAEDEEEIG